MNIELLTIGMEKMAEIEDIKKTIEALKRNKNLFIARENEDFKMIALTDLTEEEIDMIIQNKQSKIDKLIYEIEKL